MESSNSNKSCPGKAKLTLLDWFKKSRKQRGDCGVQWTEQPTDDSSEDSSTKDPGYQWSGEVEPGEVVVEMPLAKRVRTDHSDDTIAIDSGSNVAEDDSVAFLQHDYDSLTDVAISRNDVCHSVPLTETGASLKRVCIYS